MNILKINENPIVLLGDIHGDWHKINFYFKTYNLSNINLIQVGDFGVGYLKKEIESELLNKLSNFLKNKNSNLYVIRGNHDNPSYFDGNNVYSNIIFLQDYTILQNDLHNILCIGGAISVDRKLSQERSAIIGRNLWWKDEVFVYDELQIDDVINNLDINIVITHTAPKIFYPQHFNQIVTEFAKDDAMLIHDLVFERNLLQNLYEKFYDKTLPQYWFYGHFHSTSSEIIDEKVKAILLNIGELYYL